MFPQCVRGAAGFPGLHDPERFVSGPALEAMGGRSVGLACVLHIGCLHVELRDTSQRGEPWELI